jgi:hypothetical protein
MTAVGGGNSVAVERVVISWAIADARMQRRKRALVMAIMDLVFLHVVRDIHCELWMGDVLWLGCCETSGNSVWEHVM